LRKKIMKTKKSLPGIVFCMLILPFFVAGTVWGYTAIPTDDVTDGKFMAIVGTERQTFDNNPVHIWIDVPATQNPFQIGIFDGDTGQYATETQEPHWYYDGNWDECPWGRECVNNLIFTLYADANRDGTPEAEIAKWLGNDMPNNDWFVQEIENVEDALGTDGKYHYFLEIVSEQPVNNDYSLFKFKTSAEATLIPGSFAFMGGFYTFGDFYIIFEDGELEHRTYDGEWKLTMIIPDDQTTLDFWDGDMDFGDYQNQDLDLDDGDTPNEVPPWAGGGAVAEGAQGQGDPTDDFASEWYRISPNIYYTITDPYGNRYINTNPSGNTEWEKFTLSTDAGCIEGVNADYCVDSIPAGKYSVVISGMDMHNVDFFNCDFELKPPPKCECIGVTSIKFVVHEGHIDYAKFYVGTKADHEDNYFARFDNLNPGDVIELKASDYPEKFPSGYLPEFIYNYGSGCHWNWDIQLSCDDPIAVGALSPPTDSTGEQKLMVHEVVWDELCAAIGDTVWKDENANQIQDQGEEGIPNVRVLLKDETGFIIAQDVTDSSGKYLFGNLMGGTYTVEVDETTIPAGYTLTTGNNPMSVTIADEEQFLDADFGYQPGACDVVCIWVAKAFCDVNKLVIMASSDDPAAQLSLTIPGTSIENQAMVQLSEGFFGYFAEGDCSTYGGKMAQVISNICGKAQVEIVEANRICTWEEPPAGGEGCTPGYWKQAQHFDSWVGYQTGDSFKGIFGVRYKKTLLAALKKGGGGKYALGRHATAALLNAANPGVDYFYTEAQIISMVQAAWATGNYGEVKNLLAEQNEKGCPLN
jgi:hypothetical protein